ncbi:MAG: DNA translocase FtsK 4TM domain-containing protein, partial [Paracoccaceae bacterium]|nr:DNA translocase FtsK 4TM domain-containing protein [Paracoccaceae bacterium]
MASYHVREREPLLDQQVQQMLTRRGRQILGLCLLTVAVAFGCMLASYSPNDAGWMVETSAPVQNLFGPFGAAVASMMMVILGYGAWTIMLIFGAWGFRTLADLGSERAIGRLTFGVIAVALAAVFVACYEPAADWPHAFGLGGLFGDTVLAALLQVLPEGLPIGLNFLTVTLGFSTVASLLFVMGCTISELGYLSRLSVAGMLSGFGVLWQAFARVLEYGADQMRQSAIGSRSRLAQRPEAQTGYDAPPLG